MKFFTLEMADITAGHLTDIALDLAIKDTEKQFIKNGFQGKDHAMLEFYVGKKFDSLVERGLL